MTKDNLPLQILQPLGPIDFKPADFLSLMMMTLPCQRAAIAVQCVQHLRPGANAAFVDSKGS